MSRRGLSKFVLLVAVIAVGTTVSHGGLFDLEVLPAPAPAVVPVEGPHVVHDECCGHICDHCSPDAQHRYRLSARRLLKREGSLELCMHVVNPKCCGLPVEIPMCLPACCATEPPVVETDRGLLGRGIVCFEWPCCGYSARVVFKHNGRVHVVYRAR